MNWKDLWNKKYLMISVYVLLTALLYHLGSRVVDHLEGLPFLWTAHFSWLSQVTSPLLLGFALAYLLSPLCSMLERFLGKIPLFKQKEKLRKAKTLFSPISRRRILSQYRAIFTPSARK